MTEKSENPLDPVLDLGYSVSQRGGQSIYTYYLTIAVSDTCLNGDSLELITDPEQLEELAEIAGFTLVEGEVNEVASMNAIPFGECDDPNTVLVTITNNPSGKAGTIVVLVAPPPTSNHSPQGDGKSIIRFEKARLQPPPPIK